MTKRRVPCDDGFAFRCCTKVIKKSFMQHMQKGLFIVKNKISIKKMCTLALLTALCACLALCATFRVGNQIKISLKFIPVFVTGALYGPLAAGMVAAAGDLANSLIMPVGPYLPQITAVEFLYGILFGVFFHRARDNAFFYLRAVLCAAVTTAVSLTVMTVILTSMGYLPGFLSGVAVRLPAVLLTAAVHIVVCAALRRPVFYLKAKENEKL